MLRKATSLFEIPWRVQAILKSELTAGLFLAVLNGNIIVVKLGQLCPDAIPVAEDRVLLEQLPDTRFEVIQKL